MSEKPTREDLESMRQEYVLVRERAAGEGLPFSLDDDITQVRKMVRTGRVTPEQWAKTRGVPVNYAQAVLRYIED